jgi:hypothetical protein
MLGSNPDLAVDEWVNFFAPFFDSRAAAEAWVARCEALTPPQNAAKIMMHQTQRLISLADDMPRIRQHAESLQLLFVLVCAEHVAKLHHGFAGEGQSRAYVKRFFDDFVRDADRQTLSYAFADLNDHLLRPLSFKKAVDILYGVRCDVAHEGNCWGFAFHDGVTPMINVAPDVEARISLSALRDIVVRGCIQAVSSKLPAP